MLLYVKAIRKEIERSLQTGTTLTNLIVIDRRSDGQLILHLRDDYQLYLADNHGPAWVLHRLPIQSASDREYLFGVKINFIGGKGQDTVLSSASMLLAVRLASSEVIPMVRAEWDSQGIAHAQPHWHVYPSPTVEGASEAAQEPSNLLNLFAKTGKIHWAMCANWFEHGHKSLAYEYDFEKIEALANWLGGCMGYLKRQVEYIEKKMPTSGNFFVEAAAMQK